MYKAQCKQYANYSVRSKLNELPYDIIKPLKGKVSKGPYRRDV